MENYEHNGLFIATQGPLKNTIESFWLMLINNESSLIIALSKSREVGRVKYLFKKIR